MLLHKMRETDMIADGISMSAAISACMKGDRREQALMLIRKIRRTKTIATSGCEKERR